VVAMAIENMKAYEEISALKARLERENVTCRKKSEPSTISPT
jgi:hypothetical protein